MAMTATEEDRLKELEQKVEELARELKRLKTEVKRNEEGRWQHREYE